MKTNFDTTHLLNEIEMRFGKTVTPLEIKKDYCCRRSFFKTAADLLYGDTDDFDIVKIKPGKTPFIIFVNGFLTADQTDNSHWKSQLELLYPENAWFHLRWNSKQLLELGTYFGGMAGKFSISLLAASAEKKLMKELVKEITVPIAPVAVAAHDLVRNPWHQALYRAEQTGILLTEYIYRNSSRTYILMGHSLGARVIFYALYRLGIKRYKPIVEEARLMGGAVGIKPVNDWKLCSKAVCKGIFNYYTENDMILKILYKTASFFTSEPVGIQPILCRGIRDRDCSEFVSGHSEYIENLSNLFQLNPFGMKGIL